MKRLYILRHGSAEDKNDTKQDFDRKLTKDGEREAKYAAKSLVKAAAFPDTIISSPAKRALKTARIFCNHLDYPLEKLQIQPVLYESSAEKITDIIASQFQEFNSVCIVGHNPVLEEIVKIYIPEISISLPKGSITCIEMKEYKKGSGRLLFTDFPGSGESARKQLLREMSHDIYEMMIRYFENAPEEIMKSLRKTISGASLSMAKKYSRLAEEKALKIKKSKAWSIKNAPLKPDKEN